MALGLELGLVIGLEVKLEVRLATGLKLVNCCLTFVSSCEACGAARGEEDDSSCSDADS